MNNAKHLWSRHQPCTLLVADLSPLVLHALRHKKGLDLGRCTSPGSALHDWILERGRPQWISRVHQRHGRNRLKFKIIKNSNCIPCSTSNTVSRDTILTGSTYTHSQPHISDRLSTNSSCPCQLQLRRMFVHIRLYGWDLRCGSQLRPITRLASPKRGSATANHFWKDGKETLLVT